MLSESARNCAFVFHARLLELCFLGGLVCRRSFWTLFGFATSMVFSMDCCLDHRTFDWPDYNHCWSIARHLTCKVTLFCHTVVWPLVTNTW